MPTLKKLIFGPLFLISFAFLIYLLEPKLKSLDIVFSLSLNSLFSMLLLSSFIALSSLLFIMFVSLASNWKMVLPVGILASVLPIIFIRDATGFVISIGSAITLVLTYLSITSKLKSYLTFEPASLLGPPIRYMTTFLIIVFSFTYFLSVNKIIQTQGFEVPDELLETALKITNQPESPDTKLPNTRTPTITPEQMELLRKNPEALKQAGFDPKILDSLDQPSTSPSSLIKQSLKQALKSQLDSMIKPYLGIIPAVFGVLFFLILQSLTSFLSLLIYPFLWIFFYLFEKTGFIKFTEEQRVVKKMVV